MREVEFQEIGMENFGPYIDPMILPFNNDSLVLITGPNGIGKTMAIDALPFTLFGITSKGARGDDVVNNRIGKGCHTWAKFKSNDVPYRVDRYHKYPRLGNTVHLFKNNEDKPYMKGHQEVVPVVEKLICPRKSFSNTLMFGQKVKNFFTDLVDSDKKEIFRGLLDLQQYQDFYKKIDNTLKEVKKNLEEIEKKIAIDKALQEDAINQIKILQAAKKKFEDDIKVSVLELKKSFEENERLVNKWEEELENIQSKEINIEEIITELSNVDNDLNNIENQFKNDKDSILKRKEIKTMELNSSANKAENEIKDKFKVEFDKLADESSALKDTLNKLTQEAQEERHHLELKIETIKAKNNGLKNRIDEIKEKVIDAEVSSCPLCEQDLNKETIQLLTNKTNEYGVELDIGMKNIISISEQVQDLNSNLAKESKEINLKLENVSTKKIDLQHKETDELGYVSARLDDTYDKVEELGEKEIDKLNTDKVTKKKDLENKKVELTQKMSEQENIQRNINEIGKTIINIESQMTNIQKQIQNKENEEYDETQLNSYKKKKRDLEIEIEMSSKQLNIVASRMEILEFWKIGFSSAGIPSMLIDEAIPFMNVKVSEYLDKLTNGRYIVSFDTLAPTKGGEFRDKISVNVVDTYTRANARIQLSGGQTRVIDIATILTLGDLQSTIQDVKFNILLFDEIFDALDEENIGYVSKVLTNLKFGKSIYLISHRHEDQLEADQILTLH